MNSRRRKRRKRYLHEEEEASLNRRIRRAEEAAAKRAHAKKVFEANPGFGFLTFEEWLPGYLKERRAYARRHG